MKGCRLEPEVTLKFTRNAIVHYTAPLRICWSQGNVVRDARNKMGSLFFFTKNCVVVRNCYGRDPLQYTLTENYTKELMSLLSEN